MRVVLDTNILVFALLVQLGYPARHLYSAHDARLELETRLD
jgi:predicted nucleic acid-binding protein